MKDLSEANYILGIQIIYDRRKSTIALSQTSYINNILTIFNKKNSKKEFLPFRYGVKLSKEQSPKNSQEEEDMKRIPYASALGSLMYAILCTKIDISFTLGY